jgi:hypothetical protein
MNNEVCQIIISAFIQMYARLPVIVCIIQCFALIVNIKNAIAVKLFESIL